MKKLIILLFFFICYLNSYSTEKTISGTSSSGRWIKIARIQNQNPIGSSERSQFSGFLNASTYFGNTGNEQYSATFSFGCRGGVKPLLFEIGDASKVGKAGRMEWRIYTDPDGYHYLWLWQSSYCNYLVFDYKSYYGVEYWTFENPPTDYTLVWSSYSGERQSIGNTCFNENVGIGTSKPDKELHIKTNSGNAEIQLESVSNDYWNFIGRTDNKFTIQGESAGNAFNIDADGNVGIGTDDPKAKLSVNGTIISKEIKVLADISNYPDFVFNDDYELKSISEIKTYIKLNKHLPEIPTSEEVEEVGVNLGEMNSKLLQKIEELTLYLIEQNDKIENLENEIQKIKKEK